MTGVFGMTVRDAARDLKIEIDRIRYLKSREDANRLAEKLEAFATSIPSDYKKDDKSVAGTKITKVLCGTSENTLMPSLKNLLMA